MAYVEEQDEDELVELAPASLVPGSSNNNGEARALQNLVTSGAGMLSHNAVGSASADGTNTNQDAKYQHQKLRGRVLVAALALGILGILGACIQNYVFDEEVRGALLDLRNNAPSQIKSNFSSSVAPSLDVQGISLYVGAWLPLLVCGSFGVLRNNGCVIFSFSLCNCMGGCVSIFFVLYLSISLYSLNAQAPEASRWFVACDPMKCINGELALTREQTIDCLAGAVPDYETQYSVPHLSPDCIPIGLDCIGEDHARWRRYCDAQGHLGQDMAGCRANNKCHLVCSGSGACGCVTSWRTSKSSNLTELLDDLEVLTEPLLPHFMGHCEVDMIQVDYFHDFAKSFPLLVPRIVFVYVVFTLTFVPLIVFHCLVAFQSRRLYDQLSSGYMQMPHPSDPLYRGQEQTPGMASLISSAIYE